MYTFTCSVCGEDKGIEDFYVDKKGYRKKACKQCVIKQSKENQLKNAEHRKEYLQNYHAKRRDKRKNADLEYKDKINDLKQPCYKCGETRKYVLDFHHIDPSEKSFNINRKSCKSDIITLLNELSKCICLCRNCHMEFHYFYGQNPKDPVSDLQEYLQVKEVKPLVKALSEKEVNTLNRFDEYYKHLCKSKVLEGIGMSEDPEELKLLNIGAAIALTAIKGKEKEDYFA